MWKTHTKTQITYLEEYYLTNDEIEVLEMHAADLVAQIPSGAMVIELGSGFVSSSHTNSLSSTKPAWRDNC